MSVRQKLCVVYICGLWYLYNKLEGQHTFEHLKIQENTGKYTQNNKKSQSRLFPANISAYLPLLRTPTRLIFIINKFTNKISRFLIIVLTKAVGF